MPIYESFWQNMTWVMHSKFEKHVEVTPPQKNNTASTSGHCQQPPSTEEAQKPYI